MKAAKIHGNLAPHAAGGDWVSGWGVLSSTRTSWHLPSVHEDKASAESEAASLGEAYRAVWGAHRPGTEDFIHEHEVDCSAMPLIA
ncbi:hypothetical protein [Pseudomonas sp. NPDC089758]|uniref:hypothetical protein n=1 Tax=Pseudomonas sp. NPDC089758 TaxID=3364473 RepID=UPI003815F82B